MERTAVTSRAIRSVGYDDNVLEIEFRNGRVYRYFEVPRDVYLFLLRTPEKGRYVNRIIAERYRFEAARDPEGEPDLVRALQASLRRRE